MHKAVLHMNSACAGERSNRGACTVDVHVFGGGGY